MHKDEAYGRLVEIQHEFDTLARKYPDFVGYVADVERLVREAPEMSLDHAYQVVKFREAEFRQRCYLWGG